MTQEDFEFVGDPNPPLVEQFSDIFTLMWQDKNIKMTVDRFATDRRKNITAEITVDISDAPKGEGHIVRGRQNLLSTFRTLISDCIDFGPSIVTDKDWKIMFKQMSNAVIDRYRMGEPLINLATMSEEGKKPHILAPFIYEGNPTTIFGRGGVGKSLFCLYLSVLLQTGTSHGRLKPKKMNVLYLDYEADPSESKYRCNQIARGLGIDPSLVSINYRHCSVPLVEEADVLFRYVREINAECVIVDSAIPACGDALDASNVANFFNALRSLSTSEKQVASLIIGHTTKANDTSGGPFGSTVWRNGPRSIWEFKSEQQSATNEIDVQLIHTKSNLDPLLKPIGFKIKWLEGSIEIKSLDTLAHPTFSIDAPLADRIERALQNNSHFTIVDIAKHLDTDAESVEHELNKDNRFLFNHKAEKWENLSL
tara:strand:+ start:2873 stop:4144 length:1272 start_codon:yes stop_codon:yes gene_type:complete